MPTLAQMTAYTSDVYHGRPAKMRSSKWAAIRDQLLLLHPACAVCGCKKHLNVHHILPFHIYPQLELDPANLIVLGEKCPGGNHHLWLGHLGNWKSWNASVVNDAAHFRLLLTTRPEVPYRM